MKKRKPKAAGKAADAPFVAPNWDAAKSTMWPLAKIKPYPNNPREHPADQVALLAELMKKYGPDQPIVVDEKGVILKGHGRLLAAKLAGFEEFPVAQHTGRSEADKRAIRIADNQVALLSSWNPTALKFEYEKLKLSGFEVKILGFDKVTMRDIELGLGDFADEKKSNRGSLLELINVCIDEPKHKVERGDHYKLGKRHHLFCVGVIKEWSKYIPTLAEGSLFCPYPGVFVPFGENAGKHSLVMVQPDTYIAGHILDRWSEINGKKTIEKVAA